MPIRVVIDLLIDIEKLRQILRYSVKIESISDIRDYI